VPFAFLIKPREDVMLNGQTFSSRTGKTSGLPDLNYDVRIFEAGKTLFRESYYDHEM
jgi:hypothetical protein